MEFFNRIEIKCQDFGKRMPDIEVIPNEDGEVEEEDERPDFLGYAGEILGNKRV